MKRHNTPMEFVFGFIAAVLAGCVSADPEPTCPEGTELFAGDLCCPVGSPGGGEQDCCPLGGDRLDCPLYESAAELPDEGECDGVDLVCASAVE